MQGCISRMYTRQTGCGSGHRCDRKASAAPETLPPVTPAQRLAECSILVPIQNVVQSIRSKPQLLPYNAHAAVLEDRVPRDYPQQRCLHFLLVPLGHQKHHVFANGCPHSRNAVTRVDHITHPANEVLVHPDFHQLKIDLRRSGERR